jgi:hypothetical protein
MMHNLSQQEQIEKLRREEALRRAAAGQQTTDDDTPKQQRRPALARLGAALSNAGDYLQERYDDSTSRNYGLESA